MNVPIIDSHVHIYNAQHPSGPKHKAEGTPFPTTVDELRAVSAPQGVVGVVVIETDPEVEENRRILSLADDDPFIIGLVGNLQVGAPGFAARLAQYASDRRLCGVRVGTPWCPLHLDNPQVVADLRAVAEANLAVDVVRVGGGDSSLLADVCTLADRVPALRIIVDHLPFGIADGEQAQREYRTRLAEVAKIPQAYIKVSNILPRGAAIPTDPRYYAEILDDFVALFGTDRLIYGSNWPISARVAPHARALTILLDYYSRRERSVIADIFRNNALRVYGLS